MRGDPAAGSGCGTMGFRAARSWESPGIVGPCVRQLHLRRSTDGALIVPQPDGAWYHRLVAASIPPTLSRAAPNEFQSRWAVALSSAFLAGTHVSCAQIAVVTAQSFGQKVRRMFAIGQGLGARQIVK